MNKKIVLLLGLIILVTAGGGRNMGFQFGNSLATLTRSGSRYFGNLAVLCIGGSGSYNYQFTDLPAGWSASENVLTIPNIVNVLGTFVIGAKVTDMNSGAVIQGDIRLVINGVNVLVQASGSNTDNDIKISVGPLGSGGAPSGSGPAGGSPSGGSPSGGSPSGGSPSGGSPSGGSPSGGSPGGSPASPLYENYPGLPSGSGPSPPPGGRYPTPPPPSGNPSTPNIVPSVINNLQAPYVPSRDSKPTTIDDVKKLATFNRQLNANKGVANLISIIQQLTANVNAAKNDIGVLENQLKDAQSSNNDCNNRIFDLSNTRTKIQNAIRDRQDKITQANKNTQSVQPGLKDLINTRDNLITKRDELEKARSPNSAKLQDLQRQLRDCTNSKQRIQRQLDNINSQINDVNNNIRKTQDDASSAPNSINQINQQIPIVDSKIDDLRRQLDAAQRQKNKLIQDRDNYQRIIDESGKRINDLQRQLRNLKNQIPDLESQIAQSNTNCNAIQKQLDDLRSKLAQKQADYKDIVDQINTQQGLINNKKDQIKRITDGISNLPSEIATLQQQLSRVQDSVRRQYYLCNDAADAVLKAQQNLNAMKNKFDNQSKWLKDANVNLQKARSQKQLADLAVQEIITASTNALPYSVVPNGNGLTPSGSPMGNNPSGSPLGGVPERNQVVSGSPVVIGDLSTYLSQAYGAGVDPSKPSTVTTLFPLSSLTLQALTGQDTSGVFNPDGTFVSGGLSGPIGQPQYNGPNASQLGIGLGPYGGGKILATFACGGGAIVQGQANIVGVLPGRIVAQQNGNKFILNVAQCSNLNAVQRNYSIVPNTQIWFKGNRIGQDQINLYQLTCV